MKFSTFLSIFFLSIKSERDPVCLRKIYLLENDFWNSGIQQAKLDKKFLHSVSIVVEGISSSSLGEEYYRKSCHFSKDSGLCYAILNERTTNDMEFFPDTFVKEYKNILGFRYFFTDQPVKDSNQSKSYVDDMYFSKTYKLAEKGPDNIINLKNECKELNLFHIKERFETFSLLRLLKLNEYIAVVENFHQKKFDNESENKLIKIEDDFNLCYFKDKSDCLESLKRFVSSFPHLTLVDDESKLTFNTENENCIDVTTSMKTSKFKKFLVENFINDSRLCIANDDMEDLKFTNLNTLFVEFCDRIKQKFLDNEVLLPICGEYDIEYYLKHIYEYISESLIQIQEMHNLNNYVREGFFVYELMDMFNKKMNKLQETAMNELFKTKHLNEFFYKLFDRKVETLDDYKDIEKMVYDYYNMHVYYANLAAKIHGLNAIFAYFTPASIDPYYSRIVEGIELTLRNPAKFKMIIGKDINDKEITLDENLDYFVNSFNKVYCVSEELRKKNVHIIEVILTDCEYNKWSMKAFWD